MVSVVNPNDQLKPMMSVMTTKVGLATPLKNAASSSATPTSAIRLAMVVSRWATPISSASRTALPVMPTSTPG